MNARLRLCFLAIAALSAAGCGSLVPLPYEEAAGGTANAGEVVLVGRIDLDPPLRPGEQKIELGAVDVLDYKAKLTNRAVLYMSDRAGFSEEPTARFINPVLGQWFAFRVPRTHLNVVRASIYMRAQTALQGRKHATTEAAELMLPAPFTFDARPTDQVVYVGQWRIRRGDFNELKGFSVTLDEAGARAFARDRLGASTVRTAVPEGLPKALSR